MQYAHTHAQAQSAAHAHKRKRTRTRPRSHMHTHPDAVLLAAGAFAGDLPLDFETLERAIWVVDEFEKRVLRFIEILFSNIFFLGF